ncbi:MAG: hypothetical protein Q9226_003127 [Calogaya cf. arnoldii]
MGNCLTRPQRSSQDDDDALSIFYYPTSPAAGYGPYAPPSSRSYYSNAYYSGPCSRSRSITPDHKYSYFYKGKPNRYSHSNKEKVKVYNLHPYPLEGRTLGPLHRAAEQENITIKHVPGGCYRGGRCEQLHQQATIRGLKSRGVDRRGLSIGQCLRVARGFPADGGQGAGKQQGGAIPPVPAEHMLEMGNQAGHGEERQERRVAGGSKMGARSASGVDIHGWNNGVTGVEGRGSCASRSGMGSQRDGRGMDYESAGHGGGRRNVWENDDAEYIHRGGNGVTGGASRDGRGIVGRGGGRANSQYEDPANYNSHADYNDHSDHNDDAATYVEDDRYSVD